MPGMIAVLTGDLVGSTKLGSALQRRIPEVMEEAFDSVRGASGGAIPLKLDVFRGDSWQTYVQEARLALWAAMYFRALLRERANVDTRVAIAIGPPTMIQMDRRVSAHNDEAFVRSGRLLNELEQRDKRVACTIPEPRNSPGVYALASSLIASLADEIGRGWTQSQAQALTFVLEAYPSDKEIRQEEIAEKWKPKPVGQSAVSKNLRKARWHVLSETLKQFEELVAWLEREPDLDFEGAW